MPLRRFRNLRVAAILARHALRPLATTLAAIVLMPVVPVIACGSAVQPGATPTVTPALVTPTPTASTVPIVTFHTDSGETASLTVEIADSPEERARGLMFRESLPEDAGMLFVWPDDTLSPFWMKDTLIPLSIAFIDASGVILDIQDMQPLDESLHTSPGPYRYAVEANQGWFAGLGIGVGDSVVLPESVLAVGG